MLEMRSHHELQKLQQLPQTGGTNMALEFPLRNGCAMRSFVGFYCTVSKSYLSAFRVFGGRLFLTTDASEALSTCGENIERALAKFVVVLGADSSNLAEILALCRSQWIRSFLSAPVHRPFITFPDSLRLLGRAGGSNLVTRLWQKTGRWTKKWKCTQKKS